MSENTVQKSEEKKNKGLYWMVTVLFTAITVLMLIFASEWFWLGLPFMLTSLVLAADVI